MMTVNDCFMLQIELVISVLAYRPKLRAYSFRK